MNETLQHFFRTATGWPIWQQFRVEPSHVPTSGSIFNFSEYLAAVALFLVVITVSDFRYSYRLSLTKTDLRKLGFWIALGVGVAILFIDIWYENELPILKLISNPNNLKAALGFIFLGFVFRAISVAVINPPVFGKSNSTRFFEVHLDTDYREFVEFNARQIDGYRRAALAFLEDYLKKTKGRHHPHSYALMRMLDSFENAVSGVYRLNGLENFSEKSEYARLSTTVDFIKDAIALVDKHAEKPRKLCLSDLRHDDIFDRISRLIFDVILAAASPQGGG